MAARRPDGDPRVRRIRASCREPTTGTYTVGASPVVGVSTAAVWEATDPWPIADPLTVGGSEYTRIEAIDVFDDGTNNERGSLLFRELTAALLNQAAGSDTSRVATTLTDVDAWLVAHPPGSGVKENNHGVEERGEGLLRHADLLQRRDALRAAGLIPINGIFNLTSTGCAGDVGVFSAARCQAYRGCVIMISLS